MGKVGKHNKPSAWAARSFKELMYGFETLKHDREEPANWKQTSWNEQKCLIQIDKDFQLNNQGYYICYFTEIKK